MAGGSIDCGIVLVDKPPELTSHDVVHQIRRSLSKAHGRKVRVGHSGTLDPFATGLLVILLGRATRLQRYLQHQPKTYLATARLGWRSDTGDRDGVLTETGRIPADPQLPTGVLELAVPRHSAIKVDGQRLYAKARRGEEFTPPTREMTVYRAQRMALSSDSARFEIDCAGGTYIRSVIGTIEDAYCSDLVRTRVGDLRLEDADPDRILDPLDALSHLGRRDLSDDEAGQLVHGRSVPAEGADAPLRLVWSDRLLGVGVEREGKLVPETILAGSLEELAER